MATLDRRTKPSLEQGKDDLRAKEALDLVRKVARDKRSMPAPPAREPARGNRYFAG